MEMKKKIVLWACLLCCASSQAQSVERVDELNDDINAIKRDTSFIYAESTMRDALEAQSGAQAILELKLQDWLRGKRLNENPAILISNSKDRWITLLGQRGNYTRIFVYVSKWDLLPDLKPEVKENEDTYTTQDKIAFIKKMYKDFFENSSFDIENLSELRKYLSLDVAMRINMECPYDGCDDDDSRYVVEFLKDGSLTYERPDPGNRVVTRSIKPLKCDWFEVTNIWDVIEEPIKIGLKVQNTKDGLRVVDFSTDEDKKTEGLSTVDNTIEDWELLISPEEQKMLSIVNFNEIEPYIKKLKAEDKIYEYGKYSTMPKDATIHLFIYNKDGEIVTVLMKTSENTYNLKTREKDVISNYKGCGAIWFRLLGY